MTWVYQILTLNEYNCLLPTAYCLLPTVYCPANFKSFCRPLSLLGRQMN